jgi:UDP-N-acetylmuramoyl-L-alanyl-D-glutamate--2,6-diaminopimelate ligase
MAKRIIKRFFQKIKNIFWHLPKSIFFNLYYGYPSRKLTLIAITGTDGKTTTSTLIHQCLLQSGIKAGLITTLGAKIGENEISTGLHTTSPDPSVIHKIFSQMIDQGLTHAVVEVTAHAIDQYRFFGCKFNISVLTNISHEHLDDFLSLSEYTVTKKKLIDSSKTSIINQDDQFYKQVSTPTKPSFLTVSINHPSNYRATEVKLTTHSLKFKINGLQFVTDSPYYHQIYNILCTYAVIDQLGLSLNVLQKIVIHFPLVKGRGEEIKNNLKIRCIVDFAHTPAALESTLSSLKKITPGKLIVIFGATGGRDQSKRPLMGKVVSKIADIAIVTADDTRNEKIAKINSQIISGIDQSLVSQKTFTFYNIPNRQDAFDLAIQLAAPHDTVIACGKGHETTILHGNTEYPWSEAEAFRTAFRQKNL